jgi:importin subunit beta-1
MNELELVLSALVTSLNDPTADQEIVLICIGAILNTISNCGPIFKDGKGNIILDQVIKCCVY